MMRISMPDRTIYKHFFEQINENLALIKISASTNKVETQIEFIPNPAFAGLLGLKKHNASRKISLKELSLIFPDETVAQIERDCINSIRKGYLQKKYSSHETEKIFRLSYSPINENSVALLLSELSDNKKTIKAKKAAEKDNILKKAFIADISHEIRTPLNSIIGFTGMLLDSMQDEGDRKIIQTIQKSGKQLLHLINDIVDLSKIEERKISIDKTAINLGIFMDNIKEQFEGYRRNEYKLDVDFYLEMPGYLRKKIILIDEYRLHQVLSNLLSNAFKFTSEGEIILGVNKEKDQLVFSVRDTGSGISKDDQEIIFDRFKQSDNLKRIEKKGTGLGLTISKGLINLMKGEIWLESEADKGSAFYFSIPLEESTMDTVIDNNRDDMDLKPLPDLGGKHILIAEDDPYSLEMISFLVKATGADISFAEDGEQALDLFVNNDFDLALLDIRLPKITGYELVKKMKSLDPQAIVVAQTAYALSEDIRTFREKGFDEYLTKPINPDLLYKVLRKYLE